MEERTTYFRFLDSLRESGKVNMFGAEIPLKKAYSELSQPEARKIVLSWMKSFGSRE